MNSGHLYTTIGAMYDHILSYIEKTGKDLPMSVAMEQMREQELLTPDKPPIPPYKTDISKEEFHLFLRAMPVDASFLMDSSHSEFPEKEADFFPQEKDVFSYIYLPYTGKTLHYHDYFELSYIVDGSCTFIFEGEKLVLQEGNICIVSNGAWHEVTPTQDCTVVGIAVRKSTFSTLFSGLLSKQDLVSIFFRKCLQDHPKDNQPNFVIMRTRNDPELFRTMHELVYESNLSDKYANDCSISLLNLLLARAMRSSAADVMLRSYKGYSRHDMDFSMILQYIQQNYKTVNISSLATAFHYSEAYLSKLISRNMNESFTDLLRTLKLEHATKLLLHTTMKIGDISNTVGYISVNHFTRIFRQKHGMTPREFRRLYGDAALNGDAK